MKRLVLLSVALVIVYSAFSQDMFIKYQQAEQFMDYNIRKKLYNSYVEPTWQKSISGFTYSVRTRNGKEFYVIDADKKTKTKAFDPKELTEKLNKLLNKTYESNDLPFNKFNITKKELSFELEKKQFSYTLKSKELNYKENKPENNDELTSPDGKWIAFIKDGNIGIKNSENGKTKMLTDDGSELHGYGYNLDWYFTRNITKNEPNDYQIEAYWSTDSRKLIVPQYHRENVRNLYLYKVDNETMQAEIVSYERGLAGDTNVTKTDFYLFDIPSGKKTKVEIPRFDETTGTYVRWFENTANAYFIQYSRGYKYRQLIEIDSATGITKVLLTEKSDTYVENQVETMEVLPASNEFIWRSEKDGWSHLYLHDLKTGTLKKQLTSGAYYVYGIDYIDQKKRQIWFTAGAKEAGRDPFLKHFYTQNIDNGTIKLLTPEDAFHNISISEDGKYFIDNYSANNKPNTCVLRNMSTGKQILEIEKQDISELEKMGWKPAEQITLKAPDGVTDIFALIYKPTDFNPNLKYPIIDATYTGPHGIRIPKTFNRAVLNQELPIAELGFIVVCIDGRGMAFRSKKEHDFSYKRLGYNLADHVYVIKELAKKFNYIDTSKVGIYGHSAGGYDATRALLQYPDFYKVGVSNAADHDMRMEKTWWPELYQGFPVDTQYVNQSNVTNAHKLKGKLLLLTGDLDNNVNPAATMRLAAALIKANKDFEFVLLPNNDHSTAYWNKYGIRKRWDFFVKHLLNKTPPHEYLIK